MGYIGGKGGAGVFQRIINLMPPHEQYIEPFLGSGAVLRAKRGAARNIGIDIDAGVIERSRGLGPPATLYLCDDGIRWLQEWRGGPPGTTTVIYCDPPYLLSTRGMHRYYKHEMTDEDHVRLLKILTKISAMVIISGYRSKLYSDMLKGWNSVSFQGVTRQGPTDPEWPEMLWFNYPTPVALHDYTYIGEGFRERQRIRKKIRRWKAKLANMPVLERQAILAAIAASAGNGA